MPVKARKSAVERRREARLAAAGDQLEQLAAEVGIGLDEQLQIQAAIAAAHAAGDVAPLVPSTAPPAGPARGGRTLIKRR